MVAPFCHHAKMQKLVFQCVDKLSWCSRREHEHFIAQADAGFE